MRISDWSSDVCSSDLVEDVFDIREEGELFAHVELRPQVEIHPRADVAVHDIQLVVELSAPGIAQASIDPERFALIADAENTPPFGQAVEHRIADIAGDIAQIGRAHV